MIIFADKNLHQNSLYPDSDWTGEAKWIIPDSNTELCQKAFEYCPYFDVIEDEEGKVVDIIPSEKPISLSKSQKLEEISMLCTSAIVKGIEYNGKAYAMTINDQINIETLKNSIIDTTDSIPYHADGEICSLYPVEEFLEIYHKAIKNKLYHTTYFNQLKDMIKQMTSEEEVQACYYGMELDEEHQNNLLNLIK